MALDTLNTEINTLRDAAASEIRKYQADREAAKTNPNLSPAGKEAVLQDSHKEVQGALDGLRAKESAAINAKLESLERNLHTRLGDNGSDILAMRDAEERADGLKDQNDALRAFTRAARTQDKSLAYAIIRRANEMGWGLVIDAASESYPAAGEALRDIRNLTRFRDDITQVLAREMAYSIGRGPSSY